MTNYPWVEKTLQEMQRAYSTHGVVALPAGHPLAIGDVVVVRTVRDLVAVDFRTGKRLWEFHSSANLQFDQL